MPIARSELRKNWRNVSARVQPIEKISGKFEAVGEFCKQHPEPALASDVLFEFFMVRNAALDPIAESRRAQVSSHRIPNEIASHVRREDRDQNKWHVPRAKSALKRNPQARKRADVPKKIVAP